MIEDNSEYRYGRRFGDGMLIGDHGNDFLQKPLEQQVKELAWSHACPVVDDVIVAYGEKWAENHPQSTQEEIRCGGMRMARQRYAECNFMYGVVKHSTTREPNSDLYQQLTSPVPRLPNEPDGQHPTHNVPESHKDEMSPMSTPWGYALPRIVIEQMGRGKDNRERTQERILRALDIVDESVPHCKTPIELTVKLSEAVSRADADPKMVLYHLLSAEILHEENCPSMFRQIIAEIEKNAPVLSRTYSLMSKTERKKLGIVDF